MDCTAASFHLLRTGPCRGLFHFQLRFLPLVSPHRSLYLFPSSAMQLCSSSLSCVWIAVVVLLSFSAPPSSARISPRLDAPLCSNRARVHLPGHLFSAVNVQLDAWGDDSIRVRMSPEDIQAIPFVQALLPFPPGLTPPFHQPSTPPSPVLPCAVTPRPHSDRLAADLTNGNLAVSVGTDGQLTVNRVSDGATLVQSTAITFTPVQLTTIYTQNYSLYSLSLSYTQLLGQIYGLGEHKTNSTAYNNYSHLFENSQIYGLSAGGDISMPFYISTAGFGFLYNQAGYGSIHIAREMATWTSNATHQLDLWVTTSPQGSTAVTPFPSISSHYADATGHPNPLPQFASGFWQSKDRSDHTSEFTQTHPHPLHLPHPLSLCVSSYQVSQSDGGVDSCPTLPRAVDSRHSPRH